MILYAYSQGYYYEVHIDFGISSVTHILKWRDGRENRPDHVSWDELDQDEQDLLLPKIRKAVKDEQKRSK